MVSALTALLLVATSLGLLLYLLDLLWRAVRAPLESFAERRRFERYVARAASGDRLLQKGAVAPALAEFQAALYPYPARSAAMVDAVLQHHTALLSRLFAAADQVQGERLRLMSLAKTDRLLHERRKLQRRLTTLQQSGSQRRLSDLEGEFQLNTQELKSALAALTHEIVEPASTGIH
jgi:hypothetical protein